MTLFESNIQNTYDLAKEPEARAKLKTSGFVFVPQPLTLPAGAYQLRAVVREKATGASFAKGSVGRSISRASKFRKRLYVGAIPAVPFRGDSGMAHLANFIHILT